MSAAIRQCAVGDGAHHLDDDLLALAADDQVDPGGFAQDLLVHEGGVDAAEHRDAIGQHLLGEGSVSSAL
jgi:hypothetical protein